MNECKPLIAGAVAARLAAADEAGMEDNRPLMSDLKDMQLQGELLPLKSEVPPAKP